MTNEWNPDHVTRYHSMGKGVRIYRDIMLDPHVFGCVQSRKFGVVSKAVKIIPYSKDPEDISRAELVKYILFEQCVKFRKDIRDLMDAPMLGYNFQEIGWTQFQWPKEPRKGGYIGIREMWQRDPGRFMFHWDGTPMIQGFANMYPGAPAPEKKFLISCYEPFDENPYGNPILAKIYWCWWMKKQGMKFWAIFNEKFLMPMPVGKVDSSTGVTDRKRFLEILQSMQTDFAAVIDNEWIVEFVESARASSVNSYDQWVNFLNNEISKGILGQTMTTQNTGTSGGYADAKVGENKESDFIQSDCEFIEDDINELIHFIIDYNYNDVQGYPKYKILYEPEKDMAGRIQVYTFAYNSRLPLSKKAAYEDFNLTPPEQTEDGEFVDDLDVLLNEMPQGQGFGGSVGMPERPDNNDVGFSADGNGNGSLGRYRRKHWDFAKRQQDFAHVNRDVDRLIDIGMSDGGDLFDAPLMSKIRNIVSKKKISKRF
jgi:hypothetical protein